MLGSLFDTQTEITIDDNTEFIAKPSVKLSACEMAMLEASTVLSTQDTHENLYPAFLQCNSVDEFIAASKIFPNALDGADEKIYIYNQCQVGHLKKSTVCVDFLKK